MRLDRCEAHRHGDETATQPASRIARKCRPHWPPTPTGYRASTIRRCSSSNISREGERFRHTAQFNRWRPDRDPHSCTYAQLEQPLTFNLADIVPGLVLGDALPGPRQ